MNNNFIKLEKSYGGMAKKIFSRFNNFKVLRTARVGAFY